MYYGRAGGLNSLPLQGIFGALDSLKQVVDRIEERCFAFLVVARSMEAGPSVPVTVACCAAVEY